VHRDVGIAVLVITFTAFLVAALCAVRRRTLPGWSKPLFIAAQVVLMVQALIGIKLLDQGSGFVQLYIHYVGGLGPLLFYMLMYWFPARDDLRRTRVAALVTGSAFLFAVMAYTIGGAYAGTPSS
jgi:heme A synthase